MRVKSRPCAVVAAGSYGKMFSVIQSSWTLREAETKKGRCSVSGNGPLMYPRLLDVVADAAFVARTLDAESLFRKCGEKSEIFVHNPIFATKPQVEWFPLSSEVGMSRICRILLV